MSWRCAVLSLVIVCSRASAGRAPPCDPPVESAIVRVERIPPSDQRAPGTGVVRSDGYVLTEMSLVAEASGARVITSTGRSLRATAVASYLSGANIALLSVDWEGAVPTAPEFSARRPEPKDAVKVEGAGNTPAVWPMVKEAIVAGPASSSDFHVMWPSILAMNKAGCGVFDDEHRLVGLVNGFGAGVTFSARASFTLACCPVALLKALEPGHPIAWEEWAAMWPHMKQAQEEGQRARTALRQGQFDEAAAAARRSIALDSCYAPARETLGIALMEKEEYFDALLALSKAISLDPTSVYAGRCRAYSYGRLGRFINALGESKRVVALAPRDATVLREHGWYLWRMDKFEEARDAFEESLRLKPDDEATKKLLEQLRARMEASPRP